MSAIRYSEAEGKALLERMAKAKGGFHVGISAAHVVTGVAHPSKRESKLELRMAQQISDAGLPEPVREYFHITGRDFRLDFAWPSLRCGLEVQGQQHRVKGRYAADIEKRALGLLAGWKVIEVNGKAIKSGQALIWLCALLQQAKSPADVLERALEG